MNECSVYLTQFRNLSDSLLSEIALNLDTCSHVIPGMHYELAATMDRLFGS